MRSKPARWPVLLLLLALSCAGPAELARRGDAALAGGDPQHAFELSARALDRQPGNAPARATIAAAAQAIGADYERRIRAVAEADSLVAAAQALEYAGFRARAARYVALPADSVWAREERTLRHTAARVHYRRGEAALDERRPKAALVEFLEVERFVPDYRDVARLVQRATDRARTRVALLPLRGTSAQVALGREVADAWQRGLTKALADRHVRFTQMVPVGEIERAMTVAELGRVSREDAIRIGRQVGARLVVWGAIGGTETDTHTDRFEDVVLQRVKEKDASGETERWVDVPIEVVARRRDVTVEIEYELISTDEEVAVARRDARHSLAARTLWTSPVPGRDPGAFALLSDPVRAGEPERARRVETRWKAVVGERTSLPEVLRGVQGTRGRPAYRHDLLPRFYPDATGPVFLDDLPPAEDLAFAALVNAWDPLLEDLVRLDAVDAPDLAPVPDASE